MGSGYSSNSRMFAKRGDPWVSRREGIKDFGRNLETEDAEYDFDHRFHDTGSFGKPTIAKPHVELRDKRPGPKGEASFALRKANILRKMNNRIKGTLTIKVDGPPVKQFRPCDGCRNAACLTARDGLGACQFPMGRK